MNLAGITSGLLGGAVPGMAVSKLTKSSGRSSTGSNVGNQMAGSNVVPKGYDFGQLAQFTPEQMDLFKRLFSQVGPDSFLSKLAGGDEGTFEKLEAPAFRQFQGLQDQIASRFSNVGLGARRSSGFQNTMNQATSDFAQDLQSQRLGLQRQAIQDLMGISNQLLGQRPYESMLAPKQLSFLKQLLAGSAGGLTQAAATLPFVL